MRIIEINTDVDENSDTMTEKFEQDHQWELRKNCFINKIIRHLENQMTSKTMR